MLQNDLKKRRERIGLKQGVFARIAGVPQSRISLWEHGHDPAPQWAKSLLMALELAPGAVELIMADIDNAIVQSDRS
jgi:DNA-binding transcriptional regulator YiaG